MSSNNFIAVNFPDTKFTPRSKYNSLVSGNNVSLKLQYASDIFLTITSCVVGRLTVLA